MSTAYVPESGKRSFIEGRLERMVERLRAEHDIPLAIRLWNGHEYALGSTTKVVVKVPKASALRYLASPDLAKLGGAYVEGHIDVEGSLKDIFEVGERFARSAGIDKRSSPRLLARLVKHTRARDKRAIRYHYDVSNDFYRLFLDPNMVYSCAYFRADADSLEAAQMHKLDHILTKLQVRPGDRLLDIGCGWGALILRAAQKFGARATGVTLSENQFALARERIKAAGLEGRCEVRLQDYRDIPAEEKYERISSVGMFEHVGLKNLPVYFKKIESLLAEGGTVMNHGITSVDPDSGDVGLGAGDFIDRYVFPDGELPHISLVLNEMERAGLEATDVESLRRHYAKTCGIWAEGLEKSRERAIELAGDKRYRIWSVYLAGCAYGFAHSWMNIYQVLAARRGGPGANTLPMTREYMYSSHR